MWLVSRNAAERNMPSLVKLFVITMLIIYLYIVFSTPLPDRTPHHPPPMPPPQVHARTRNLPPSEPLPPTQAPRTYIFVIHPNATKEAAVAPEPPAAVAQCTHCGGGGGGGAAPTSAPQPTRQARRPPQLADVLANLDEILQANGMSAATGL